MSQVLVLRGLPGSGKSTHARALADKARAEGRSVVVVSTDDFFVELGGGTYAFDVAKLGEAHATCFRRFLAALGARTELVVVDNTNTSAIEMSPYMLGAYAFGYTAKVLQIACDRERALTRNVHGVPVASFDAMSSAFASEKLPAWWTVEHVDAI
jgi:predicted kinase